MTERRRLGEAHSTGHDRSADLVAEVLADLVHDLIGELGAGVVHHADDRGHFQGRVEIALDEVDIAQQLAEALQCVVLALDGNQDLRGGVEAIDGQQAERGWAVDQHVVVVVEHGMDGLAEAVLATERRDQFDLGTGQVEAGRGDEEVLDGRRLDAVLQRHLVHDHVVHRRFNAAVLDAEPRRGIPLWIEVDDECAKTEFGKARSQVDRGGGLADASACSVAVMEEELLFTRFLAAIDGTAW